MPVLIVFFFAASFILAFTHIIALQFYLYWQFLWLDIPMHILGGICVALGISILPFLRIYFFEKHQTLAVYLLATLVVGLIWEVFEYANGISLVQDEDFVLDTLLDLFFDLTGGTIGYYLINRLKTL